jgi:hypothetical protein
VREPVDELWYARFGEHPAAIRTRKLTTRGGEDGSAEYLPLYRCIEGFCMLSERLFCTTLKPVALAPGETWAPNVQKLEACHATEGVLGHIYLDLSPREGTLPIQHLLQEKFDISTF